MNEETDTPETLADILAEMRRFAAFAADRSRITPAPSLAAEQECHAAKLTKYADRIDAAAKREREELVKSVEELRDGMCPHCDMQHLCAEGEDGMPTTCNAMAKVNAFVARYKPRREPNDGIPF